MTAVVCLDNNNGLLFNNRRQSRDSEVISDIKELTKGKILITPFSEQLFNGFGGEVIISRDGFTSAEEDDFCFLENINPNDLKDKIKMLVVYYWNRSYPSDFLCTLDFNMYKVCDTKDFAGNSHEKITRIIYDKRF